MRRYISSCKVNGNIESKSYYSHCLPKLLDDFEQLLLAQMWEYMLYIELTRLVLLCVAAAFLTVKG